MNDSEIQEKALNLSKRVKKEAKELDALSNGALASFFGGVLVLGFFGGQVWWLPAGMSGSLILYRLGFWYAYSKNTKKNSVIEQQKEVIKQIEYIDKSMLSEHEKEDLKKQLSISFSVEKTSVLLLPPKFKR